MLCFGLRGTFCFKENRNGMAPIGMLRGQDFPYGKGEVLGKHTRV